MKCVKTLTTLKIEYRSSSTFFKHFYLELTTTAGSSAFGIKENFYRYFSKICDKSDLLKSQRFFYKKKCKNQWQKGYSVTFWKSFESQWLFFATLWRGKNTDLQNIVLYSAFWITFGYNWLWDYRIIEWQIHQYNATLNLSYNNILSGRKVVKIQERKLFTRCFMESIIMTKACAWHGGKFGLEGNSNYFARFSSSWKSTTDITSIYSSSTKWGKFFEGMP